MVKENLKNELQHFLVIKSKLDYLDLNEQDLMTIHTIFSDLQVFVHGNKIITKLQRSNDFDELFDANTCLSNLLRVQCTCTGCMYVLPSP